MGAAGMFKYRRWYDAGGSVFWVAILCVIVVLVLADPQARTVVGFYRDGTEHFLSGLPLYNLETAMGFLYTPAFAVLFWPFYQLGAPLGEALWRLVEFAVLSYAAFLQVRRIDDERPLWLLSCGLFLAAPLVAGSLRNGQATILLAGACWLLVLAALEWKPLQTFLWAAVALVAKPTAIVMLLLVGAIRPRLIPMLMLALAIVLALPYAFGSPQYVSELNRTFFSLMFEMSLNTSQLFSPSDFTAPFRALGINIQTDVASAIRAAMALPTLAAVAWFARNGEKRTAGLVTFVLASYYMCAFNPRVENNTYSLLAVPFGVSISLMLREDGVGVVPVVLAVLLFATGLSGIEPHVLHIVYQWYQPTASTIIFLGIMWWFWRRTRLPSAETAAIGAYGQA
jgi:hypothetical protein